MNFTKMQAFGNDYIYMNFINKKEINLNKLAKKLCNRNYGIGSDGLVLICSSNVADFKMRIFNPDGSEAEMCGNALRSVGKYVYEKSLTSKCNLKIETKGGIKEVELIIDDNKVINIKANIGKPEFNVQKIPVRSNNKDFIMQEVQVLDKKFLLSSLSWGNPHTVVFVSQLNDLDILKYGPAIENLDIFPNRTNVTFAEIVSDEVIKIREWERGTGETIGCGTGCSSAVVVAHILKKVKRDCRVEQIGGILNINWHENGNMYMLGPSFITYEGFINLEGDF